MNMKTIIQFKLNDEAVKITANSVECKNSCVQVQLVKMLVECRSETEIGKCPLALFFNKYLSLMDLTHIEFIEMGEAIHATKGSEFAELVLSKIAA